MSLALNLYGVTFLPEQIGQINRSFGSLISVKCLNMFLGLSVEYIVFNYLFDKGETVSEGLCFTSQSKVTGLSGVSECCSFNFSECNI